jgi:DNA-binding transcriptional ArsR family regulator
MSAAVCRPSSRSDTFRRRRQEPPAPATKSVPWYSREGVYYAAVRDVSSETRAEMNRRQCALTWYLLHEALHDQARRGRTEAIRDAARRCILDDVGVMGLHRISGGDGKRGGVAPKTIRRHLEVLEEMGLVKVCRPPVRFVLRDGRLHKAKGQGREMPIRIVITVDTERHCRPAKRQVIGQAVRQVVAESYRASVPSPGASLIGRHDAPSTAIGEQKENETPSDTDGIGAAVASTEEAGLPAGEAGGQEAATHEGGGMDFVPALPPPRRRKEARTPPPRRQEPQDDDRPTSAEMGAEWKRGAAESARRAENYKAEKAARRAEWSVRPASTPPAASTPPRGQDDAKAVFRDQWRVDHGRPPQSVPPAAAVSLPPDLDEDAAMLDRLVAGKLAAVR